MVPVLPIVNELIKKYRNHPRCIINNRLMPIDSNARYNGYLKEIATICGIKRDLNIHLARHTFADIMLNSGVPLEDVSKMLGIKIYELPSGIVAFGKNVSVKACTWLRINCFLRREN